MLVFSVVLEITMGLELKMVAVNRKWWYISDSNSYYHVLGMLRSVIFMPTTYKFAFCLKYKWQRWNWK